MHERGDKFIKYLVGKLGKKIHLEMVSRIWDDNIKIDLKAKMT
jgi:hypothetical protein